MRLLLNKWVLLSIALVMLISSAFLVSGQLTFFNKLETVQNIKASTFGSLSYIGNFISELKRIKSLTEENIKLKEENTKLLSRIADQLDIKDENIFLRESNGLDYVKTYKITDAKTFNANFTPEGHQLLINKGSDDGVEINDIIISSSNVLIGSVSKIFEKYSQIILVTDPDFKATIKLMGKETKGISVGKLSEGIGLDFISQSDDVAVGDMAVTSGNDLLPAGLILGAINSVSPNDGNIFKKITVTPEFTKIDLGRILILNK